MSEEEIINKWFEKNMCVSFKKFTENWEEQQELTNYLQQENSQLKELLEKQRENNIKKYGEILNLRGENLQLKERIEKAIEYIENDLQSFLYSIEYKKLLEILKGDKE